MTIEQKELKNKLIQNNYDYYIWNNKFINDNDNLRILYNNGFCKSLALKTLESIKKNVLKNI